MLFLFLVSGFFRKQFMTALQIQYTTSNYNFLTTKRSRYSAPLPRLATFLFLFEPILQVE